MKAPISLARIFKPFTVRVGPTGARNAFLGKVHEFGSRTAGIPERSFLRGPLERHLKERLETLLPGAMERAAQQGPSAVQEMVKLLAMEIAQESFATRGDGTWAADKEETIQRKGSNAPLIDTGQLRESISAEVAP